MLLQVGHQSHFDVGECKWADLERVETGTVYSSSASLTANLSNHFDQFVIWVNVEPPLCDGLIHYCIADR